jgi:hypothetical protein
MVSLNIRATPTPERERRGACSRARAIALEGISKDSSVLPAPRAIDAAFWPGGVNGLAGEAVAGEVSRGAAVTEEFRQW